LGVEFDTDTFVRGFRDGLADVKPALSDDEARATMSAVVSKKLAEMKRVGEENKKKERAFLDESARKEGVLTLQSGLQYQILKEGTGRSPPFTTP
jgi:FKBP-type peptidyl-prolyl cis-trans isomerase FklB